MSIMDQQKSIIADLSSGREKFLALVADIRPQLYRYCRHHNSVSPDFSCGEKAKQVLVHLGNSDPRRLAGALKTDRSRITNALFQAVPAADESDWRRFSVQIWTVVRRCTRTR
jgi:hypothetical protein